MVIKNLSKYSVIIFLLLISNITFISLYFLSSNKSSFVNDYPLIDPARSIVSQDHFFSTIEPLRESLKQKVKESEEKGLRIGLYFEFLNTGSNVSINQESRFWPASLSKIPTAIAVMKKVERGDWKLTNELILFAEDRNDGYGTLYKKAVGTRITIEELLNELIINSDDTAHRILIRNLEGEDFETMLRASGMEELYNDEYDITAKEYSRIFRSLYTSSYLNRENSTYLLNKLSNTNSDQYLGGGIPKDVVFAHKFGIHSPEKTHLDSGIVYVPNRPYILTVMIDAKKGGSEDEVRKLMSDISNEIYEYVKNH